MDDLIADAITDFWGKRCPDHDADCDTCKVWDRYDALRSAQQRERELMEALEPFAKYAMKDGFGLNHKGEPIPDGDGVGWVYLTNGDFRRAARALPP